MITKTLLCTSAAMLALPVAAAEAPPAASWTPDGGMDSCIVLRTAVV